MSRELVVATRNPKKGGEMAAILSDLLGHSWRILTVADFPDYPEPAEEGASYGENAAVKAEAACRATGKLCIADDAGLEIDALSGEPGIHSKRFGGEGLPFPEKIARILDLMKDVPDEKRTARFRCAVAIAGFHSPHPNPLPGGEGVSMLRSPRRSPLLSASIGWWRRPSHQTTVFESVREGRVARLPAGCGGFGYDSIFYLPELGRTFAELEPEQKNRVSHRGMALLLAAQWLEPAGRIKVQGFSAEEG